MSGYLEEKKCILLIFKEYPPKLNEGNTATGLDGENITRTYVTFSYDDGKTWTAKRDITAEVKLPVATGYATGPGVGIRVEKGKDKGRILIPVNVSGGRDGWFNYLVYSDDLGESWNILEGRSSYGTNESQIVEIAENEFIVNARCHKFEGSIHDRPVNWGPWNFPALTKYRGFIPVNKIGRAHV